MRVGLEVTAALHRAAHEARREMRAAAELGAPPDALRDVLRASLLAAVEEVLALPAPCGQRYEESPGVVRVCERERGHTTGVHAGNL